MSDDEFERDELDERADEDDGPFGYPGLVFYRSAPRWFTAIIFVFFLIVLLVCLWL